MYFINLNNHAITYKENEGEFYDIVNYLKNEDNMPAKSFLGLNKLLSLSKEMLEDNIMSVYLENTNEILVLDTELYINNKLEIISLLTENNNFFIDKEFNLSEKGILFNMLIKIAFLNKNDCIDDSIVYNSLNLISDFCFKPEKGGE